MGDGHGRSWSFDGSGACQRGEGGGRRRGVGGGGARLTWLEVGRHGGSCIGEGNRSFTPYSCVVVCCCVLCAGTRKEKRREKKRKRKRREKRKKWKKLYTWKFLEKNNGQFMKLVKNYFCKRKIYA
jgi:hypothetical protein